MEFKINNNDISEENKTKEVLENLKIKCFEKFLLLKNKNEEWYKQETEYLEVHSKNALEAIKQFEEYFKLRLQSEENEKINWDESIQFSHCYDFCRNVYLDTTVLLMTKKLKNVKELEENTKIALEESENIKSEILTMMGLFFAIFTFVQVNFTFTHQFLEKYNGYRLLLFITIINAVLLIVLGFMLEAIGTIVYGKNKAREGIIIEDTQNINSRKIWLRKFCTEKYWKSQKYLWLFPESKLKMKRALVYSLIGLFVIGTFSFYNEKKNYSRSYEEIDQIIMKKVENKISSINKTLSEDEKKQIKLEIENSIYRDLYNQSKKTPQAE